MGKELLKWGAILLVALVAWRYVGGMVRGLVGSGSSAQALPPVNPVWQPNTYVLGVYGQAYPGNPFFSSPAYIRGNGGRIVYRGR
ncbi:MAG: hypothetical protein WB424_16475 [Terracidiphilus sp.]